MASDVNKPNGIFVVTPGRAKAFINELEVKKFFEIEKVTAAKLNKIGVWYGKDLRMELVQLFGKAGNYYYTICRGINNRMVQPSRERKSVGVENTFANDLFKMEDMENELLKIAEKVWERATRDNVKAKTLTHKFKYADFEQHTGSKTLESFFHSKDIFWEESRKLLYAEDGFSKGIRLLGLTLSNFIHE